MKLSRNKEIQLPILQGNSRQTLFTEGAIYADFSSIERESVYIADGEDKPNPIFKPPSSKEEPTI